MGLRTPPSRTAPTAMNTKVHAAQEVKNSLDHRVSTRRRPRSRNGPMEAIRLSPLRTTNAVRCGPGVVSEKARTAKAPRLYVSTPTYT